MSQEQPSAQPDQSAAQQPPPQAPPGVPGYPQAGYPPTAYPPTGQPGTYPSYAPAAPVPLSDADARMWGMLAWLLALLVGFIAPLVIYLVYKDRSEFARQNAVESLNVQITSAIVTVGAAFAMLFTGVFVGLVAGPGAAIVFILFAIAIMAVAVYFLVITILGAVKANAGQVYRAPWLLRLVK